MDVDPDVCPVSVDVAELELALINLSLNAKHAMPGGGRLRIRTAKSALSRSVAGGEGGEFVVLEISDTGTGMPPEVAARAFEPFFTTKKPGKGTGLGLSMIYGFARQANGTATIRTELGHGTTVTLRLRRSREQRATEDATGLPAGGPA